jgi:hypothetical protein
LPPRQAQAEREATAAGIAAGIADEAAARIAFLESELSAHQARCRPQLAAALYVCVQSRVRLRAACRCILCVF